MAMVGLSIGVAEAPPKVSFCGQGAERGDASWRAPKRCRIVVCGGGYSRKPRPSWRSVGRENYWGQSGKRALQIHANSKADDSVPFEMSFENALKLLGVAEGASFEEIVRAKKLILDRNREDQEVAAQVEAAYDMLLMQSFKRRRAGKVVDSSIRFADVKQRGNSGIGSTPEWLKKFLKNTPVTVEPPSANDLGIQTGVYGALMVWTFVSGVSQTTGGQLSSTGADVPGLILATGFGASLYFLRKKNMKLDVWWTNYGRRVPELQRLAIRVLSQTCSASGCERNWSVFEKIHSKKRRRLLSERLNAMVYVYYNLRLQVKQIEKVPNPDAISLDDIDTTSKWRVEREDPVMEEAPEWLEEEGDDDADPSEEEGEEEEADVPLPEDDYAYDYEDIEEEVDTHLQRRPAPGGPPPPQSHTVGTGRRVRQLTFASPSSTASTRAVGGSSSTPGSSGPPPRPPAPTASRGRVVPQPVPLTRKRGRLIRGSSSGSR